MISKSRHKGDRVGNAFARAPMLMVKTVRILKRCGRETTLTNFCEQLGVPVKWFMEKCESIKIYNTFPLYDINVFKIYDKIIANTEATFIKLEDDVFWAEHYHNTSLKILYM